MCALSRTHTFLHRPTDATQRRVNITTVIRQVLTK